ncbi:MAG TPA: hypothetical protein VFE65_14575 [Pseudonocardia sp.]|jgi:hypothetical protein|nr:hypothetical protein [Pseudonocardia sp.]
MFDQGAICRWSEAAARAHHEWCQWSSVSDRASPAANEALLDLKRLLAESIPKAAAEWATTNRLVTGRSIEVCVREELPETASLAQ